MLTSGDEAFTEPGRSASKARWLGFVNRAVQSVAFFDGCTSQQASFATANEALYITSI